MKTILLSTSVWWRAQGFYFLLNVLGCMLYPVWNVVAGSGENSGELIGLALFSVGFALMCGLPAWIAMSLVMAAVSKVSARRGLLGSVTLVVGLLATKAALYIGFGIVLGDTGIHGDDPLVITFCILAYASMVLSVFSLRKSITRHAERLNGVEDLQYTSPAVEDFE